jgi:hypothetical protein
VSKLIALLMEAASTSETSVNFYQTTLCNNPEDSHLHTRRCKNLKSHHKNLDSPGWGLGGGLVTHLCKKNCPLMFLSGILTGKLFDITQYNGPV